MPVLGHTIMHNLFALYSAPIFQFMEKVQMVRQDQNLLVLGIRRQKEVFNQCCNIENEVER